MATASGRRATLVVAEAPDPVQAAIWVDALRDAGIEAATFERGVGAALGGSPTSWSRYPVLIQEENLVAARNVISEMGGAGALSPYRDPADTRARQTQALRAAGLVVLAIIVIGVAARLLAG